MSDRVAGAWAQAAETDNKNEKGTGLHYDATLRDHGLPHDPFKALVAPRPIGWIGTLDAEGRANLAPYSFFNAVGDRPPLVMFSSAGFKHRQANVEATGELTCSLAHRDLSGE